MSDTGTPTAVTDLEKGILQLAQLNNTIAEKNKSVVTLEDKVKLLEADIAALETNKKSLEEENQKIFGENKQGDARRKEQFETAEADIANLRKKLEEEKQEIAEARILLEAEKAEVEKMRSEAERLSEENKQIQAEVDSKTLEAKRLTEGRKEQIEAAKAEREANETACKRLEILKSEVEKEKAENDAILARIEEAKKGAEERSNELIQEQQKAEEMKRIAQQEQEAANFIKNESYKLTMIFRQAIHTYVQMNGTVVQIPDITDEHRLLIIKDLLAQCETAINPSDLFGGETIEEIEDTTNNEGLVKEEEIVSPLTGEEGNKVDSKEEKNEDSEITDFKKLPKAQLAEFAKANYNLDLNIDDNTHAQMVQAIVDEIQKQTQI